MSLPTPRYWLTVHWPHPTDPAEDHAWFVYLQHEHRPKGQELAPGDGVAFYETANGKPHRRKGSNELARLAKGRQAVIGIADVSAPLRPATIGQSVREYADGAHRNWAWEVPCAGHRWGQPVPCADVLAILNRGSMRFASGLLEIEPLQFEALRQRLGM